MSRTNLAHKQTESNLFHGGYRVLSAHRIQLIIEAATSPLTVPSGKGRKKIRPYLNTQDLRVFCALTERWFGAEEPAIEELQKVLAATDKAHEVRRSLDKIRTVLERDTAETAITALIPRRVLRYLSGEGNSTEVLVVLRSAVTALRKERFEFRAQTQRLADELHLTQKVVSNAIIKLRKAGIISDVDPFRRGANHSRNVQAKGLGKRYRWSCYDINRAPKAPTVRPKSTYDPDPKAPTFDTKTHILRSEQLRATPNRGRELIQELVTALAGGCGMLNQPHRRGGTGG
jgi:hypothetical protein